MRKSEFDRLIKLAAQPVRASGRTATTKRVASNTDKQTRLRKTANTSEKQRGTSR